MLDRWSAAGSVGLTRRRISWQLSKKVSRGTERDIPARPGIFLDRFIEFILVQDGMLDLKLDGVWVQANAGDLVRLPRGISHGYFNKSDKPARALFWVSPTQKLEALFNQLHNLTDVAEIVRISAEHEVNFLPPEAND